MAAEFRTLIDPATLEANLGQVKLVDCRAALGDASAGESQYLAGHIPGAVYANLDHDLSAPITSGTGRHPLPTREVFATTLGKLGISDADQVVAYDDAGGAFAARLWWMMRWLGHDRVCVLDGGFSAWQAAGFPVSTDTLA